MRILFLVALLTFSATAPKKKEKPEVTQVRALPKDPPAVAFGETSRLVFHVSPLSNKGLLTPQTREAIKALMKLNGGLPIVHIRAFVAGSGDLRRVPQIISEVLTDKHQELPSISVIQTGGLPMVGAQVVLEATSVAKKPVNLNGLTITKGFPAPTLEASLTLLATALGTSDPQRVTCYVSQIEPDSISTVTRRFPKAIANVVQTQRAPVQNQSSCEAVGRGGPVTAARLAFTGTQIAFGYGEKDAALAFQRFDQQLGANTEVVTLNIYPLSQKVLETARKVRPSLTTTPYPSIEGLASMDGTFAIDAIAVAK